MAAQLSISSNREEKDTLVVVFLRGAADGLTLVAPVADDNYHRFRPRLAVKERDAVPLDGFFALHPNLRALESAWKEGDLAIVHGVGGESDTRSHFEAQDLMEHGGIAGGGWLGRFLRTQASDTVGPLSAVALGRAVPECLRGAPAATVLESLEDFSLGAKRAPLIQALGRLYGMERNALGNAGRSTLDAVRRIETLRTTRYSPSNRAVYGADNFSRNLSEVARLIKARVGLQAASLDLGGWDSHFG